MANKRKTRDSEIDGNIRLCDDGVYRWRYELSLIKNWSIFFLVWKILFFIMLGIFAIAMLADAVQWSNRYPERLYSNLKFWGYFLVGMTVIVILGYLLYAAIMGWKYCVIFEMDENGINHRQVPEQAKKAEKLAKATTLSGVASRNVTTVGVGMNSARAEMYSDFLRVRKIKAYKKRELIKISTKLSHNQVYVSKEDFDFVFDYIKSHCPQAKTK